MYVCTYVCMYGWIWSLPVTAAASVILKKNEEENLAEIKREILKVIDYSGESAHLDPPADVNFNKNSVVSTQDPEPMEAQELEITSQTIASNIIDLTNTKNSEITKKNEAGSAFSVNNKKNGKKANLGPKPPKPRLKLYGQQTPDARMRQHISVTKLRLDKFNKDSKKGKKKISLPDSD